jgi:hypothetical protein
MIPKQIVQGKILLIIDKKMIENVEKDCHFLECTLDNNERLNFSFKKP